MNTKTRWAGLVVLSLLLPLAARAQTVDTSGFFDNFSFTWDVTAVGPKGSLYRASTKMTGFTVSDSKLEVFDLSSDPKPVQSLTFSGVPGYLSVGQDERVFMTVNSYSSKGSSAKIYIIPTPFPSSLPGAALESMASVTPSATSVVLIEVAGNVTSLKMQSVGNKDYLYAGVTEMQLYPFKVTSKTIVYDSTGKKVKEIE